MDSHILTTKIQYIQLLIGTSFMLQQRDPKIFQKSKRHLQTLGARRVGSSKFHTKDP